MRSKLLLVEDEPDILRVIFDEARRAEFELQTAHGGKTSLQTMQGDARDFFINDLPVYAGSGIQ